MTPLLKATAQCGHYSKIPFATKWFGIPAPHQAGARKAASSRRTPKLEDGCPTVAQVVFLHKFQVNLLRSRIAVAAAPLFVFAALALFTLREPILMGRSIMVTDITRYAPWGDGKGTYHDNPACSNQLFEVYPDKFYYRENLLMGRLPAWEPKLMGGYPVEGDPRFGWFDPFNLIFLFFKVEPGLKLLAFLQIFLLGAFSYGYLREAKCGRVSACFGGMAAMTSAFVITHIPDPPSLQSVIWFPFLLWMFERTCRSERFWPYPALIALGTALSILGGEPRMYLPMLTGFALYAAGRILFPGAWECLESRRIQFSRLAIGLILGILLAMPQVLPSFRLANLTNWGILQNVKFEDSAIPEISYRTRSKLAAVVFNPYALGRFTGVLNPYIFGGPRSELFVPHGWERHIINYSNWVLYPGWVTLLLMIWGVRFKYDNRRVIILAIIPLLSPLVLKYLTLFLISLLIFPGHFLGGHFLREVSSFDPFNDNIIFYAAVALLAGFGLDDLLAEITASRRRFSSRLFLLTALSLVLLNAYALIHWLINEYGYMMDSYYRISTNFSRVFSEMMKEGWRFDDYGFITVVGLSAAFCLFIILRKRTKKWIPVSILLFVSLLDSSVLTARYLLFQEQGYPEQVPAAIQWLQQKTNGARIDCGAECFPPKSNLIFGISSSTGIFRQELKRFNNYEMLLNHSVIIKCGPTTNWECHTQVLENRGARYLLSRDLLDQRFTDSGWDLVFSDGMKIYKYKEPYKRAWIVPRVIFVNGKSEIGSMMMAFNTIYNGDFNSSEEVLIEGEKTSFINGGKGTATIKMDAPEDVVFDVSVPEGGWLVFSETYYPGWEAEVDNEAAELYKADVAFMAVQLDPGRHEVAFHYRSQLRKIGYYIASLAAYILVMGALWGIKKRKKRA